MIELGNIAEIINAINQGEAKESWKTVVDAKIPENKIKIKPGKFKAKYIDGATCISILNNAFDGKWTFIPLEERIEPVMYNGKQNGAYALVKGALVVPGLGMKIQYGTQVIVGGAEQQQSAFKGAGTDCLKKCATLFGVGAELYDDEESQAQNGSYEASNFAKSEGWNKNKKTPQSFNNHSTPVQQAPAVPAWNKVDTDKMVALKLQLEITDNNKLDPFVKEYLNNATATWESITPANIAEFNKFLEKKIITS